MYYYIYVTTNLINGKKYIGQHTTEDLNDGYLGSGKLLKRAIKKYGKESFEKVIIDFAEDKHSLDFLEQKYINKFNALTDEEYYNLTMGGTGSLGRMVSDEQKEKQSKTIKDSFSSGKRKPRPQNAEERELRRKQMLNRYAEGKMHSWWMEEGRRSPTFGKPSKKKGTKMPEETKRLLSNKIKEQYKNGRKNPRANPVYCVETNTFYKSVSQAAADVHCDETWIAACCKGKRETAKNYHWQYASNVNTVPSLQETA